MIPASGSMHVETASSDTGAVTQSSEKLQVESDAQVGRELVRFLAINQGLTLTGLLMEGSELSAWCLIPSQVEYWEHCAGLLGRTMQGGSICDSYSLGGST